MGKDEIMKTTIRVPKPLWARVRIAAIEQGTSAETLVADALTALLDALVEFSKKGGS